MSDYLLIDSRDPFDSGCRYFHDLACELAGKGHDVILFLVQNAVFMTRRCPAAAEGLKRLSGCGVEVLVDDFSLRERGICADGLAEWVTESPLDIVVDQLASGSKVLWN